MWSPTDCRQDFGLETFAWSENDIGEFELFQGVVSRQQRGRLSCFVLALGRYFFPSYLLIKAEVFLRILKTEKSRQTAPSQ